MLINDHLLWIKCDGSIAMPTTMMSYGLHRDKDYGDSV